MKDGLIVRDASGNRIECYALSSCAQSCPEPSTVSVVRMHISKTESTEGLIGNPT